jgi:hypothetical protein
VRVAKRASTTEQQQAADNAVAGTSFTVRTALQAAANNVQVTAPLQCPSKNT